MREMAIINLVPRCKPALYEIILSGFVWNQSESNKTRSKKMRFETAMHKKTENFFSSIGFML